MTTPNYVYVASSWRNPLQIAVCSVLQSAGIDHYDFRNPGPGQHGFAWNEVGMPSYSRERNSVVPVGEYLKGLEHPRAVEGFNLDMAAMEKADTFVMVLPCGRSAHLELGWAVGAGKRTAILLAPEFEQGMGPMLVIPELMYKMVDYMTESLFDLLGWLGVED